MAGDAFGAARMLVWIDLRKLLGLGLIRPVASLAQTRPGQFLRLQTGWIVGMFCERTVAGFARNDSVFALGPQRHNLVMAHGAGRLARE